MDTKSQLDRSGGFVGFFEEREGGLALGLSVDLDCRLCTVVQPLLSGQGTSKRGEFSSGVAAFPVSCVSVPE